jgi:hypothetical protein
MARFINKENLFINNKIDIIDIHQSLVQWMNGKVRIILPECSNCLNDDCLSKRLLNDFQSYEIYGEEKWFLNVGLNYYKIYLDNQHDGNDVMTLGIKNHQCMA